MAADDRKKRIMDHLAQSSDNLKFVSAKRISQPAAPATPPPTPKTSDRKQGILDHVARSSNDFGSFSVTSEQRKKQIQAHIRRSLG